MSDFLTSSRRGFLVGATTTLFIPPLLGSEPSGRPGAASWEFYETGTLKPCPVFADPDRTISLGSRLPCDAMGAFPSPYLRQDLVYRAVLRDQSGRVLRDVDPVSQAAGLSDLASGRGAALIGFTAHESAVVRTVESKLREFVSPEDFGGGRGDPTQDTQAFKAIVARDLHMRLTPGATYYLEDDVTAGHPDRDAFKVMIQGTAGEVQVHRPRIVVTKPGVTPFPVASESYVEGVAIEYQAQARTPAVGGDSWTYARALSVPSASIGTVRGKLTLRVPTGGLAGNVTRGSVVVVLADRSRTGDHWTNNYDSFDSIFQIDAILDDQTATLQGKQDANLSGVPVHIRGCALSVIWMRHQPTAVSFRNNTLGPIPGFGVVTMGAQKLRVEGNRIHNLGAPHLGVLFAGSGQGFYGDVGGGGGWGNSGVYHQCTFEKNMLFYACGGAAINGWVDSRIIQNQIDQNHSTNRALATYFPNFSAVYTLGNCYNCTIENNAAEDSPCPDGMRLYQCYDLTVRELHAHDLARDSFALHFYGCGNCAYEGVRNSGGVGDPAKKVRYTAHGVGPVSEILAVSRGRGGVSFQHYRNGSFGAHARILDQRDGCWRKLVLPAAVLKRHPRSLYDWVIPFAELAGAAGMDLFLIEQLMVDHGSPWSASGGSPQLRCGTPGNPALLFDGLSLSAPRGRYMDGRALPGGTGPVAFAEGALGRNGDLLLQISSGGPAMSDPGFECSDLIVYCRVAGVWP